MTPRRRSPAAKASAPAAAAAVAAPASNGSHAVINGSPAKPAPAAVYSPTLTPDRREWVEAWGMASRSMSHVFRPTTAAGVAAVFDLARRNGRTVALKGGGNSYGDAFQNREEVVLDTSRMTRVLDWDPQSGIIDVEPGVRIEDLWRYVIEDGWWPSVVSGTMKTTMGGCAGMNIHGKNAWKKGPFGEHVKEFDLLTPDGSVQTVSRASNNDLFRGAISGFGSLGVMTRLRLKLTRVHGGNVEVFPLRVRNFHEMADSFEEYADRMDYMVGWNDCFTQTPGSIGHGEMHFARQLSPGEDPFAAQSLRVSNQELPDTFMGVLPKSLMWKLLWPWVNNYGMRMVNTAKYLAQFRPGGSKPYMQSHAAFHFLLDYVPNWKFSYKPGGLIQYQSFVPKAVAADVFTQQVRLCGKFGIYPFLGVTKKHLPDDYLCTHAVDGYSMALDFPVTTRNRRRLWQLCHEMDELVLGNGGRFYLAKDSTMRAGTAERYLPPGNLALLRQLKTQCDPDGLLCTDLMRRVFGAKG